MKLRPPEVSNRFLTPSKSKKNASLRAPAKNVKMPDETTFGVLPNDTSTPSKILDPTALGLLGLVVPGQVHVDGLTPVHGLREHEAEGDVVAQVAVVVDGEPVDRVRMQEVGLRIRVEDQDGPGGIGRRLKGVQVAEVEALITERRAQAEPGEVV